MNHLTELTAIIEAECKHAGTAFQSIYDSSKNNVEFYFRDQFKQEFNKDFLQVEETGIHYWNNYKEEYTTVNLEEAKTILRTVLI